MGVYIAAKTFKQVVDFSFLYGFFNVLNRYRVLRCLAPLNFELELRNLLSLLKESLFRVLSFVKIIGPSVALRFAVYLLVDEGAGFGPVIHFILDVEVLEFVLNQHFFILQQSFYCRLLLVFDVLFSLGQ